MRLSRKTSRTKSPQRRRYTSTEFGRVELIVIATEEEERRNSSKDRQIKRIGERFCRKLSMCLSLQQLKDSYK